jgi:hypothetical protein
MVGAYSVSGGLDGAPFAGSVCSSVRALMGCLHHAVFQVVGVYAGCSSGNQGGGGGQA